MLNLQKRPDGRPWVIGHRGAMELAPENTFASFDLALSQSADLIELDVHLSRDGELVVMHDAGLERTTTGTGRVEDLTLAEIRQFDAGVKFAKRFQGERIPTLPEVLKWAGGRIGLIIEIKGNPQPAEGIEAAVARAVGAAGMLEFVLASSFYHPVLRRLKEVEPHLATGLNYNGQLADTVGEAHAARADSVWPAHIFWTAEIAAEVHRAQLAGGSYGVETPEILNAVLEMGLDGLGSNNPGRLRALLDAAILERKR